MLEIQNGVVVSIAISAWEKEGGGDKERSESQTAFKAVLSRSGSGGINTLAWAGPKLVIQKMDPFMKNGLQLANRLYAFWPRGVARPKF